MRLAQLSKKMRSLAVVLLICLMAAGCGTKYVFPDDSSVWALRERTYGVGRLTPTDHTAFSFYIQATAYMAGFVENDQTNYYQVLQAASLSADAQASQKLFYRFDVKNYDTDHGFEPYAISSAQFQQQALGSKDFYSVSWYFEQSNRHADLYREYYQGLLADDPDHIYDKTGAYLLETLQWADKDGVSVIVTDLVDANFETDAVMDWLARYIGDNPGKAVAVLAFRSAFDGLVYTGGEAHTYMDDERPFYLLVMGDISDVEVYRAALAASLEAKGIHMDAMLLNGKKTNAPAMNYVNRFDVAVDTPYGEAIKGKPMRVLTSQLKKTLEVTERNVLDNADALCVEIFPKFEDETVVELTMTVPLYGFDYWQTDADIRFDLAFTMTVADFNDAGDTIEWQSGNLSKVGGDPAVAFAGSEARLSDDKSAIVIHMLINKGVLQDIAPSDIGNRFKVGVQVKNQLTLKTPAWLEQYIYDGVLSQINASDLDIYGRYTVTPVSGLFDKLLRAASESGKSDNILADLLLYIKY